MFKIGVRKLRKRWRKTNGWRDGGIDSWAVFDEDFEGDNEEQIFDFIEIPSFVNAEPIYLLKVVEKGIS